MKKIISVILLFIMCLVALSGCSVISSLTVNVTEYTYGNKVFVLNKSFIDNNGYSHYKYLMATNEEYVIEFSSGDGMFNSEISFSDVDFDYDESVLEIYEHPSAKIGKAIIKPIGTVKDTTVTLTLSNGVKGYFYVEVR